MLVDLTFENASINNPFTVRYQVPLPNAYPVVCTSFPSLRLGLFGSLLALGSAEWRSALDQLALEFPGRRFSRLRVVRRGRTVGKSC